MASSRGRPACGGQRTEWSLAGAPGRPALGLHGTPGPGAGVWGRGSTCQGDPACFWGAAWRQERQLALGETPAGLLALNEARHFRSAFSTKAAARRGRAPQVLRVGFCPRPPASACALARVPCHPFLRR